MPELVDALDLSLDVGELVQRSGGHTARTVELMQRMAAALGAAESDAAISSVNVSITVADGTGGLLSAGRSAGHLGISFSSLTLLANLVRDTERHGLTPSQVRARLALIRHSCPVYPTSWIMLALGASSAAFAATFHAPGLGIALTFLGGWAGAWTRRWLQDRQQLPFMAVTSAAFVSAVIVAFGAHLFELGPDADPALAACVLFLVPGVPLLNGTADLLTAHYLNGMVKLAMSAVIVASGAVGLLVGVGLVGAVT